MLQEKTMNLNRDLLGNFLTTISSSGVETSPWLIWYALFITIKSRTDLYGRRKTRNKTLPTTRYFIRSLPFEISVINGKLEKETGILYCGKNSKRSYCCGAWTTRFGVMRIKNISRSIKGIPCSATYLKASEVKGLLKWPFYKIQFYFIWLKFPLPGQGLETHQIPGGACMSIKNIFSLFLWYELLKKFSYT